MMNAFARVNRPGVTISHHFRRLAFLQPALRELVDLAGERRLLAVRLPG